MRDDALPVPRLLLAAGALVGIIAFSVVVVAALLHVRGMPAGGVPVARPAAPPDGRPALQPAPQDDLAHVRQAQSTELQRWDRGDAASAVARVPVAVAMDRIAAQAASAPREEATP
ncbi:MAG: hypothetical protein ACTHL8_19005 [Burkholderiaceae bacterium]